MQVLLEYYTSHLFLYTMVNASLLWPLLRVPLTDPDARLRSACSVLATSAKSSSAKHQRTKPVFPLTVLKHAHSHQSEFSSRRWHCSCTPCIPPPQASCLLSPHDKTYLLLFVSLLTTSTNCSAFTFLLNSKFTARKTTTPKSHKFGLEFNSN